MTPRQFVRYLDPLLLPVLRADGLSRRESALEGLHPNDASKGHAAGPNSDRVLMVGAGAAYGWGVATHELSLCGALARALSTLTGRGCDIDLLVKSDIVAADVFDLFGARRLDCYDAIIFVLGINDAIAGTPTPSWRSSLTDVIGQTLSATSPTTDIFFVGMQPVRSIPLYDTFLGGVAERHGAELNRVTERLCSAHPRTTYIPLPAQDGSLAAPHRHRTAAQYNAWAAALSPAIATHLDTQYTSNGNRRRAAYYIDESTRQRTVDSLPLVDLANNPTLVRLVRLAQSAFQVRTAMLTIIDRDRQINLIRVGTDVTEGPRQHSFCDIAIRRREPLIVHDARQHPQFQDNPLVTGPPNVGFYAGISLTAPCGERIGALCIVDTQPHKSTEDAALGYLRELAVLAEKELWSVLAFRNG